MNKKPVSGTKEWASHSVNIQVGCEHDCIYGYCKTMAIRLKRATFESWKHPVINLKAVHQKRRKLDGTVMFPTQHDITPANLDACITVLTNLLKAGNKVLIVSKPHLECVREMCLMLDGFQKQVLFRFTIGSSSNAVLKAWEPNAPSFEERLACLKFARNPNFDGFAPDPTSHGGPWETSVSCEPMLDCDIGDVVEKVYNFVTDAIWLGKPNKLMLRAGMNTADDGKTLKMAEDLLASMTDEYIWKLYRTYKDDPKIKWKDSIKQIVGLERSMEKGLDI